MGNIAMADPTAEEALLACMLNSHTAVMSCMAAGLKREDFGYDMHGIIYGSILGIMDSGRQVDFVTVTHELEASGKLDLVGDRPALQRIADQVEHNPHLVIDYVSIIKDRAIRRALHEEIESSIAELHSEPDVRQLVSSVSDRMFRISDMLNGGGQMGASGADLVRMFQNRPDDSTFVPFYYDELNQRIDGRRLGSLTVWTGYPSDGKSITLIQEVVGACRRMIPTRLYTLEMLEDEITIRIIAMLANVNARKLELGDLNDDEEFRVEAAMLQMKSWPLEVIYDPSMSPQEVRSRQMRQPVLLTAIDYLQRFDYTEYAQLGRWARMFKNLALQTRSCIDLGAQLKPRDVQAGQNPFPRPTISDIYGGKTPGHEANNVFHMYAERNRVKDQGWVRTGFGKLVAEKVRGGRANWDLTTQFNGERVTWDIVPDAPAVEQVEMDL